MIDVPPELSGPRRWSIAGLLFGAGFINYFDRALISVALPIIAVDMHLGPAGKGVLLSAFFWSYALMQLPMGWWSDRYNLRWLYAGGFGLWSLACGFTALATTFGILIALRILLGIGESVYLPGGMKIVSLLFSAKERGLASGLVNCGTRAGLAIGTPFIAWLIVTYGWHRSFAMVGFISLIWLAPWLLVYPARVSTARQPSQAIAPIDRNLVGLCIGHIGYSYYWYLLVNWLPDYLVVSRHLPIQKAGAYAVIPYGIYSVSEPLGGWIADQMVKRGWSELAARKSIITVAFLTSMALIPAARSSSDNSSVWMIGAASLVGLATGNILALLQRVAPADGVGLWTGMLNFVGNLAGVAAPLATGLMIAKTGSYFPGFVTAVILLLGALPAYWWMVREPRGSPVKTEYAKQNVR